LFQQLQLLASDSILGLMAKYRADSNTQKVDLGVGVYRDLSGNTPILDCVRRAEKDVLAAQTTKSYVAAAGREEFNTLVEELVLGADHPARRDRRARTVQNPGGCGALGRLRRAAGRRRTAQGSQAERHRSPQRPYLGQPRAAARQFRPETGPLSLL
jgi:aspartate aminotransferase